MNIQLSKEDLRETKHDRKTFPHLERNDVYIILDNLKCAHNIGTILRLADALMVKKVFICGDRSITPPNRKIRTASRGTEKWVPWEYNANSIDVALGLKEEGVEIIAVEISSESVDYRENDPSNVVCYVFGNEFVGVSEEILSLADKTVHLPILGMTNSLNVGTAASVILYDNYTKMEKKRNRDSSIVR